MPAPVLTPDGSSDWEAYARKRGCYCSVWAKDPSVYEKQGLTPGFCGKCMRCGEPGHARHYPGPAAFTGAWCDRCYRIVGLRALLLSPVAWIALAFVAWVAWIVLRK